MDVTKPDSDGNLIYNIPVQVTPGGTASVILQRYVFPTGEFVNMETTLASWEKLFPTIFSPFYANGYWVILGDITWWPEARDRTVLIKYWYEWLMFRSDGVTTCHPTFTLILQNQHMVTQLNVKFRV